MLHLEIELIRNCTDGGGALLCFFIGVQLPENWGKAVKTPNRFTLKTHEHIIIIIDGNVYFCVNFWLNAGQILAFLPFSHPSGK